APPPLALTEAALDVVDEPDGVGVAPSAAGRCHDPLAHGGRLLRPGESIRRDPAVGEAPGQLERVRSVRAEPDRDRPSGLRLDVGAVGLVPRALECEVLLRPEAPRDPDRVVQSGHFLSRAGHTKPERAELVIRVPTAESEDETTAGQVIERGRHLGHHGWGTVRDAQDARGDADTRGPRG